MDASHTCKKDTRAKELSIESNKFVGLEFLETKTKKKSLQLISIKRN